MSVITCARCMRKNTCEVYLSTFLGCISVRQDLCLGDFTEPRVYTIFEPNGGGPYRPARVIMNEKFLETHNVSQITTTLCYIQLDQLPCKIPFLLEESADVETKVLNKHKHCNSNAENARWLFCTANKLSEMTLRWHCFARIKYQIPS